MFPQYGKVVSIETKQTAEDYDQNLLQALVSFETPEEASLASQQLSISLKGRPISIYRDAWRHHRYGQGQMGLDSCSLKGLLLEQKYLSDCEALLDQVIPENYPDYKEQVAAFLNEYMPDSDDPQVQENLPKVTEMITDLPDEDLREVMQNWVEFNKRI